MSPLFVTGQERRPVEDDVDLVGAAAGRVSDVGGAGVESRQTTRERPSHAGHPHWRAGYPGQGGVDHLGVDAHRSNRRHRRVGRLGPSGLLAEGSDLFGRVGPLQGGEVHTPDGQVEGGPLAARLDRPSGQSCGPSLKGHLVDRGNPHRRPAGANRNEWDRDGHRSALSSNQAVSAVSRASSPSVAERSASRRSPLTTATAST